MTKRTTPNNIFSQFEHDLNLYENGPVEELRGLLIKMLAHASTDAFASYSIDEQDCLQELISETKNIIANIGEHDTVAKGLVDEAEGLFYSGRYAEAIPLYEKALLIEPKWERAKNHLYESESHLRSGSIPTEALPKEVGELYGKAQSAARFGDFFRAKELLNTAKLILADYKIKRWQEGDALLAQMNNSISAISTSKDAEKLFRQGKIEKAIEKLEEIASTTGNPRYKEKAREYLDFKSEIEGISSSLNGRANINYIIEIVQKIETIKEEYGYNSVLENIIKKINQIIKDKIQSSVMLLEVSIQDSKGFNLQNNSEYATLVEFLNNKVFLTEDETTIIYQKILQANNEIILHGYESYAKVLEALVLQHPFNNDILLRYDWINTKIRINKIRDQSKKDASSKIAFFKTQALVWFWVSTCSAVILLGMSIYVIKTALGQDNLWVTLASFLSILPVFAARLFYDQALEANRRVELVQEKMSSQEKNDIEDDRRTEQQMFNKIYSKKTLNNKSRKTSTERK